jgi:hypothetical protein
LYAHQVMLLHILELLADNPAPAHFYDQVRAIVCGHTYNYLAYSISATRILFEAALINICAISSTGLMGRWIKFQAAASYRQINRLTNPCIRLGPSR